jgi:hypothetical protein
VTDAQHPRRLNQQETDEALGVSAVDLQGGSPSRRSRAPERGLTSRRREHSAPDQAPAGYRSGGRVDSLQHVASPVDSRDFYAAASDPVRLDPTSSLSSLTRPGPEIGAAWRGRILGEPAVVGPRQLARPCSRIFQPIGRFRRSTEKRPGDASPGRSLPLGLPFTSVLAARNLPWEGRLVEGLRPRGELLEAKRCCGRDSP